ncbi:antibiotic biosynthesis monooxygenase [Streptomyces venezuelae]|uniref:Antibiotic biosynthesis monooxygenase n=1 Tax=Streptomyces venezuelae TaxID=54571 RepID=A0A5P2CY24_STRVZ|nr:antibiotic biosynthesis monooxygenase [Streptomyces venezuelae]QES47353.1 antibiotic biosynthesis monooxygenase [Streptomyces venezuelae]
MSATATIQPDARPDLAHPGVGHVKASTWRVGTPERQRAAVDAIARAWQSRPWPTVGLLSYTVHIGTDGDTLLHYSQWTDEAAYEEFSRTFRDDRNAEIDAAVPGIERVELHSYTPYRSLGLGPGAGTKAPGCVVAVEAEFDGTDPGAPQAWVDLVLDALATEPAPAPGGISGTFHLGTDDRRMLNYAEWESEQAHADALAAPGRGIGSDTPEWRKVLDFPGVTGNGFRRYLPALSLAPGPESTP